MNKVTTERYYKITFQNSSTYYGRTILSGNQRYNEHLTRARKGKHPNKHIQEIYNKYSSDDWVYEWLGEETGEKDHHNKIEFGYIQTDPKALNIKSGSWVLDKKKYMNHYMNLRNKSKSPKEQEEYRRKNKEHQSRKLSNMTPEERDEHNRKQRERYYKRKQKEI